MTVQTPAESDQTLARMAYDDLTDAARRADEILPAVPADESPSSYTEEQEVLSRLADGWRTLDKLLAAGAGADGGIPNVLPGQWGFRLPAKHWACPDGLIAMSANEPALIFADGEGSQWRLDRADRWLDRPGRRARAVLGALLGLAQEDLAGLGGLCRASGEEYQIYGECDRVVDHLGDHTHGTSSWKR